MRGGEAGQSPAGNHDGPGPAGQQQFVGRIARMRRLLGRLSQLIGLAIALAVPAGYFAAGYSALSDNLDFKAQLNAERVARYAYIQGPTWIYGVEHVAAEMRLTASVNQVLCRRVWDGQGREITRIGCHGDGLAMERRRPVQVRGSLVGEVAVAASLWPLLIGTGLAGGIGLVLGAVAWATMHRLPERSLRDSLAALQQAHEGATRQSAEIAAAYDELHRQYRLVTDMTAQLTQARDDALAADRSKSAFLATMSHELRTPLNAIIGFSDMIRSEVFGAFTHKHYRAYIDDIHRSGQHLLTIVNDILDLSKVESGRMQLRLEDVAVQRIIADCDRLMGAKVAAAGVRLVTPEDAAVNASAPSALLANALAADPLPLIRADPVKLKQVLLNLLSNAVKFTPKGGTVTVSAAPAPGQQLKIAVADTGIGMNDADVAVALQPFQQVDNTISRKYDGTGLGLPLTRALVELHGGILTIASVVGTGTTVTVTLPVAGPPAGAGSLGIAGAPGGLSAALTRPAATRALKAIDGADPAPALAVLPPPAAATGAPLQDAGLAVVSGSDRRRCTALAHSC